MIKAYHIIFSGLGPLFSRPAALQEILTTSSSHAVRIRASTALLKLDPAKLLHLIEPGEER